MPLDDKELEQISKMLERGGKMLADHCETCHSPLFKFEGKVSCPVCIYRATQMPVTGSESITAVKTQPLEEAQLSRAGQSLLLEDSLAEFLSDLASKMRTETDLTRIQMQLECLERGLRIVQILRNIDLLAANSRRADR